MKISLVLVGLALLASLAFLVGRKPEAFRLLDDPDRFRRRVWPGLIVIDVLSADRVGEHLQLQLRLRNVGDKAAMIYRPELEGPPNYFVLVESDEGVVRRNIQQVRQGRPKTYAEQAVLMEPGASVSYEVLWYPISGDWTLNRSDLRQIRVAYCLPHDSYPASGRYADQRDLGPWPDDAWIGTAVSAAIALPR